MGLKSTTAFIATVGACALAIRGVVSAIRAEQSLQSLDTPPKDDRRPETARCSFRVIVPVLLEQDTIAASFATFSRLTSNNDVEVVFVSTHVEEARLTELRRRVATMDDDTGISPLRADLASAIGPEATDALLEQRALTRSSLSAVLDSHRTTGQMLDAMLDGDGATRVRHLHYEGAASSLALQVRAAADMEWPDSADPRSRYLVVYNVDSNPEPHVFWSAERQIAEIHADTGALPNVLQQSSAFFGSDPSQQTSVAQAAAVAQTRWTLGTEMPKLRNQVRSITRQQKIPILTICVGHGLFIQADFFRDRHQLPTFIIQEDLAYGFLMSADREPVHSLRTLDRADTPRTLRTLNAQKKQWFWAYLEYPTVAKHASLLGVARSTRLALLAQAAGDAILWLGTSPGLWAAIALPLVRPRRWPLAAVGIFSYLVWPQVRYPRALRQRGHAIRRSTVKDLLTGIAVVGTDSIGPYRAVVTILRRGEGRIRQRTPRQ